MATTTLGPATASAGTSNNNFQSCLKVEESVVNELLLVCGVIGTTTTTTTKDDTETTKKEDDEEERLVPVADCVLWLQDLQRALRRDEDAYRPIALLLAKWNIVPTKLLPLMKSSYYDSAMVMTLLKILVILTKPLTDSAKKAARMVIDVKAAAKKYPDDEKLQQLFIKEQGKLRANAIAQSNAILDHKRSVIQASRSSLGLVSSQQQQQRHTMLSAIVGLLTEPLSKSSGRKSDHDHLVIELVLHLIRNLLCAEPVIKPSSDIKEQSYRLQNELISVFHEELVLDIVLMLSQQMTEVVTRDSTYNLLLMEIIYHLIKHADPIAVAKWNPNMTNAKFSSNTAQPSKLGSGLLATSVLAAQQQQPKSLRDKDTSISLRSVLSKERQRLHSSAISTSRHGHFGGTLMKLQTNKASVNGTSNDGSSSIGGKRTVLSSVLQTGGTSLSTGGSNAAAAASSHEPTKMRGKGSMPFLSEQKQERGSGSGASSSSSSTFRSNRALHEFCRKFTSQGGYKNLMKSLKNEFRRDSHRLEESDKTVFFEIVWFFSKWQRVTNTVRLAHEEREEKRKRFQQQKQTTGRSGDKENTVIGGVNKGVDRTAKATDDASEKVSNSMTTGALYDSLTVTMDVFMFSMMTSSMETYLQQKKYEELAQTVTLYVECIHILHGMMHVSKDEVEQMMSLGIQFKLFYDNEPLDKLPQLLKGWEEGLFTKQYTCDLVELCHMTLKLLEANKGSSSSEDANEGTGKVNGRGRRTKKKKSKKYAKDGDDDDTRKDRMTQMKDDAAEFDVFGYVGQLVTSEKIVTGMYTHLLSRYHNNDPYINHHIVAFLLRVCRFKIYTPPTSDDNDNEQQPLVSFKDDETNTNMEDLSDCLKKFERYCHRLVTLEPVLYNVRLLRVLSDILNDVTLRGNKELTYLKQFAASVVRHFAEAARHNPLLIVDMLFKHLPNAPDYCENITNLYVDEEFRNIVTKHVLHEGMGTSSLSTLAVTTTANTKVHDTSGGSKKIVERESDSDDDDEEQEFVEDEDDKEYHPTSSKKAKKKRKKRKAIKRDGSDNDNDDDDDDASSTKSNDEFPLGPRGARFSKPTKKKSKKTKRIPKQQPSKRFQNNGGLSSDSDDDEKRSRNSENEGDDSSTGSSSSPSFPMGPRARLQQQQHKKRRKLSKTKQTAITTATTNSSSDEEEFDAVTTTSHLKSKDDDTKHKTTNNGDSEKDDENFDDDVDDKWNDRRKFVPPSKKKTTENNNKDETTDKGDSKTNNDAALNKTRNDDGSNEDEDDADEDNKKIMPSGVARSSNNKVAEADNGDDDDDDDEDDEDNKHTESQFSLSLVKTPSTSTTNTKKRLKRPLAAIAENDSDDDDLF